ncbi:UNVERIFIED_CONTAM: hypothetical protein H355_001883 [Colinus virginianus]|nr:hypothetical protein H355_001883 [Colinus virginianus]
MAQVQKAMPSALLAVLLLLMAVPSQAVSAAPCEYCKLFPTEKSEQAASGPDRPGTNLGGDESRAELGEATEENVHAQKSNNSSRPFFDEEFGSLWSRTWTDPSHQSRSSPTDSDSSTCKLNSMDFPENSSQYHWVDAGNTTTAPVGKELPKLHIPVMKAALAVLLAILLSMLVLIFIVTLWMWRQNPAYKRERAASELDLLGTNLSGDESRAELGEDSEENVHAQKSNNSFRPFFGEEFGSLWSRTWTYPSHQSWSSPTDSDSSTSKRNSMDFPENSGLYHYDGIGVPNSDDVSYRDFVSWGQPIGPLGHSEEHSPVPEPGLDAGGVTGGEGDPAVPGKDESTLEESIQRSAEILKKFLRDIENADHGGTDGTQPVTDKETQAVQGTALPDDGIGVPNSDDVSDRDFVSWGQPIAVPGKDESTIEESIQRSAEILKKFLRDIENADHGGTDGTEEETVQQEPLQEGSGDTQPVSDNDVQGTVLPGVDAGNTTTAPVGKAKLHIPVMKVVLAVLLAIQLTMLLLIFIVMLWMWRRNPARKRERAASGPDHPGTNLGGDESRAELGEATEENVHAEKSNNIIRPFFDQEFGSQWSRTWTYPSHQSRSSPTDSDSSTSKHNSMDFPENSGQYH